MSSWRWVFRCVPSARESHRLCVAHSEGDAQALYLLVYCQRGDASLHRWTARYCAIVVCECGVAAPVRSVTASNLATDLLSVSDSHSLCVPSCQRTIFLWEETESNRLVAGCAHALCPPDCLPILTDEQDSSNFLISRLTLQPTLNKTKLHIWFLLYTCSELRGVVASFPSLSDVRDIIALVERVVGYA